jgi:hypothetical protein
VSADRDWDKELAAIDRQLASVSDDALAGRATAPPPGPPLGAAPPAGPPRTGPRAPAAAGDAPTPWGLRLRLALAVALGVGIVFWPYANRCGPGLAGYHGAVLTVALAGGWTAVSTWRARAARAHLLALLLVAWGLVLTAIEVLPRVGYASDPARVAWGCDR